MSHAEICPVCQGSGKYFDNVCHGCGGLGWVTVHDNNYYWYPWSNYEYTDNDKFIKWEITYE